MAEQIDAEAVAALRKKRQFKKFTYKGLEVEKLLDLSHDELLAIVCARARRRMQRGLKRKPMALIKKLRKAKAASGPTERPAIIKTHLRNMIIVPEMIGSSVAVYNGKVFNIVDIKADMVGYYLGEFSITYRPVRHGRPGIGGNNASRFIPLK
ncbi:putative 40S ribosomal protein S15 [Ochromonadaceae sp. CCMP2298]|nr:putative 40S ribosomal protein S15 [Ochromonadaceae sp. CCMP2298]KAJ1415659.1 putative 40S ribosomal protein S15 [Ochromonadaceae sp. CCMP2298]